MVALRAVMSSLGGGPVQDPRVTGEGLLDRGEVLETLGAKELSVSSQWPEVSDLGSMSLECLSGGSWASWSSCDVPGRSAMPERSVERLSVVWAEVGEEALPSSGGTPPGIMMTVV